MKKSRKRRSSLSEGDVIVPLPARRSDGERPPQRKKIKLDPKVALRSIDLAFQHRLNNIIDKHVRSETKKKTDLTDEQLETKFQEFKENLCGGNEPDSNGGSSGSSRLPKGIFDDADELGNHPPQSVKATFGGQHNLVERWYNHIECNFDGLLPAAKEKYWAFAREESTKLKIIPESSRIRTVNVRFKHIIRPDLPEDHQELFMNRVHETAARITDLGADMAATVRMSMLEMAKRGFVTDRAEKIHFAKQEQVGRGVSIHSLLPHHAQREQKYLVDGEFIPVVPLPEQLPRDTKKDDFYKLFQQEHVQQLYVQKFAVTRQQSQGSRHPLWDELDIPNFCLPRFNAPGLSSTTSSAIQQLATNLRNIWNGGIFLRSLDRLLLVCLHTNLASIREDNYKKMVENKANEAKERKQEKKKRVSRHAQWQRLRRERKYQIKCTRRAANADQSDKRKWEERARQAESRINTLLHLLGKQRKGSQENKSVDDDSQVTLMLKKKDPSARSR